MTITKLKQDRHEAFTAAEAMMASATAASRALTPEEGVQYDAHLANIKNLDQNIARAQARLDAERTAPAVDASVGQNNAEKKPWASLGEQLMAIKRSAKSLGRDTDPRLYAALGQNETVDSEGGWLVQPEIASGLVTRAFASGIITKRCRKVPMASSRLVLNGLDDSSRLPGLRYAGIAVYRAAEAGLYTASKIKFRRMEFNANKLIGMYFATDEVLEDANALQAELNDLFPQAFAWQLDNEVVNGTGVGQFLGITTSGVIVVTPKTAGQAAGTFTTQNALDMRTRLWAQSRANAAWFIGPDIEDQLFSLTIPGTAGTAVALYTPPGINGNNNSYGMMLGMPVIPIEQTAQIGSQGDVILADFSQYQIAERSGVTYASSIHVAFETGEQAFRWTMRNDGQPLWDKPLTQANSANKVSPFVTLATRS